MTPDQRADRLARRQDGVIILDEALACGLSRPQVRERVASGRWLRPARGVYVVAGAPPTWRQTARVAVAAAPLGAVASHLTSGALLGVCDPPLLPHVIAPPGTSPRVPIAKVHRSPLGPGDRLTVAGIPCTSATRMIVDSAALLARRELEAMVDDSFCRNLSCVDAVARTLDRLGRRGRRGAVLLDDVLSAWSPGIEPGSPAEMRLLRQLVEWGYERPERQVTVRDRNGRFVGTLDLAWPRRRKGFDYDSDRWHNPRRWEHDERRYVAFRAAGWAVLAVGKRDLMPSSDFRQRVDRLLNAAAA